MTQRELQEWEVEILRLTLFTNDVIPLTRFDEWWMKVARVEAEMINRKPALATFSAAGPVDDAGLQLSVVPGRIDWLFGPTEVEAFLEHSLGKFASQDERFGNRLNDWLAMPGISVNRFAFGQTLRIPVPNRIDGYKKA